MEFTHGQLKPKAVIPYFLRLLYANNVDNTYSDNDLRKSSDLMSDSDGREEEGLADMEQEFMMEDLERERGAAHLRYLHEPEILPLEAAGQYYVTKKSHRRGGLAETNAGVTEPLHRRWSRTVWRKEVENLEPEYRLPALILKKHIYVKTGEPTRLGPGTYDPQFDEYLKKKRLGTTRGLMHSCTRRFPKVKLANQNPGPGAYGYPDESLMKAKREGRCCGNVPLFVSGPCDARGGPSKSAGSALGPGHYHFKGSIDELLAKRVSLRGPYDLYTPDRLIIPYGYYKTVGAGNTLGPGQYNVRKTFTQEINSHCNRNKGRFSSHAREQKVTGERISLVSPLWPLHTELYPGPGQYDVAINTIGIDKVQNKYAFKNSASARPKERVDHDMAPSRYNVEKPGKYCPLGCGHQSQFKSKTERLDPLKIAVLTERLRAKDIPFEEQMEWNM